MDVSSAYSFVVDVIFFVMSLIYIKNRIGPRTEPCGTPACVSRKDELEP